MSKVDELKNKVKEKTQDAIDKGKDNIKKSAEEKIGNLAPVREYKRVKRVVDNAKRLVKNIVKSVQNFSKVIIAIVTNPITYTVAIAIGIMIVLIGLTNSLGTNSFGVTCGESGAPLFNNTVSQDDRNSRVMGHFINTGMSEEVSASFSALIYSNSKADPRYNVPDDCDNNCIIKTDKSGIGLLSFDNKTVKELGQYAIDNNLNWSDSSTQLKFITNKLNSAKKEQVEAFKKDPSNVTVSSFLGFVPPSNIELDIAKSIQEKYSGEASECKTIGDGKASNFWSANGSSISSSSGANVSPGETMKDIAEGTIVGMADDPTWVKALWQKMQDATESRGHHFAGIDYQCVNLTNWFVSEHYNLNGGYGNGNDKARNLVSMYPDKFRLVRDRSGLVAGAVWSIGIGQTYPNPYGHTGAIVAADATHVWISEGNIPRNGFRLKLKMTYDEAWAYLTDTPGVEIAVPINQSDYKPGCAHATN